MINRIFIVTIFFLSTGWFSSAETEHLRVSEGVAKSDSLHAVFQNPAQISSLEGFEAGLTYTSDLDSITDRDSRALLGLGTGNQTVGVFGGFIHSLSSSSESHSIAFGSAILLSQLKTSFGAAALYGLGRSDLFFSFGASTEISKSFAVGFMAPYAKSEIPAIAGGLVITPSSFFSFGTDVSVGTNRRSVGVKPGVKIPIGPIVAAISYGVLGGADGGVQASTIVRQGASAAVAIEPVKKWWLKVNYEAYSDEGAVTLSKRL